MKGYVWKGKDDRLYLVRCPKCYKENYMPAAASGQCVWCGYVAVEDDVTN